MAASWRAPRIWDRFRAALMRGAAERERHRRRGLAEWHNLAAPVADRRVAWVKLFGYPIYLVAAPSNESHHVCLRLECTDRVDHLASLSLRSI
jgi:hypothetical protein